MPAGYARALPLHSILLVSEAHSWLVVITATPLPYYLDRALLLFPKVNERRNFFGSTSMGLSRKQGVGYLRGISFGRETRKSEKVFIQSMVMSLRPGCSYMHTGLISVWVEYTRRGSDDTPLIELLEKSVQQVSLCFCLSVASAIYMSFLLFGRSIFTIKYITLRPRRTALALLSTFLN